MLLLLFVAVVLFCCDTKDCCGVIEFDAATADDVDDDVDVAVGPPDNGVNEFFCSIDSFIIELLDVFGESNITFVDFIVLTK